jgi:cobalt-zinc-cadmium efflux system membrane fusion protein
VSGDGRSVAVVSPVSGRVTNAGANLGQFVAAETELFRVADPRRLQIMASVPLPMRAVSERATGWN